MTSTLGGVNIPEKTGLHLKGSKIRGKVTTLLHPLRRTYTKSLLWLRRNLIYHPLKTISI
jgi:hypothetical protein